MEPELSAEDAQSRDDAYQKGGETATTRPASCQSGDCNGQESDRDGQ
jgi:hypothetical protein